MLMIPAGGRGGMGQARSLGEARERAVHFMEHSVNDREHSVNLSEPSPGFDGAGAIGVDESGWGDRVFTLRACEVRSKQGARYCGALGGKCCM